MSVMRPHKFYNRRLISWLLMLALFCVALPSGASWQCANGLPCPLDCPLLTGGTAKSDCANVSPAHCAKCAAPSTSIAVGKASRLCPLSQCQLRVQTKPDAALTHKHLFTLPLLALPPPAQPQFTVYSADRIAFSCPLPLAFFPQRFLRPYSGRAPPALPLRIFA